MPNNPTPQRPGLLMPALWVLAALFGSLLACAVVGAFAYNSESAGVTATMVAAFPVGLLWSGAIAALAVHVLKQDRPLVRYGVPAGCAFVGGIGLLILVSIFFVAIFPAL